MMTRCHCFAVLLLLKWIGNTESILQTAAVNVHLSDAPPTRASYTLLVSQASFGSYPKMQAKNNPLRTLALPPSGNELLCKNITQSSETEYTGNMLLVPRGTCSFERKAYHAQQLGASGILIYGALASRYAMNLTNVTDYQYTTKDIIYPQQYNDYDCRYGKAWVPTNALSFDPLPYNAEINDLLLADDQSYCSEQAPTCPSKAFLLTGNVTDSNKMEACCAWDLSIWLYSDDTFTQRVDIPAAYLTMAQGRELLRDMQQGTVSVVFYSRWKPQYNVSSVLIWALGVFVASIAAYSSASEYHKYIARVNRRQQEGNRRRSTESSVRTNTQHHRPPIQEESMELTAEHALGFVVMASSSLLILFYFKIYAFVKVLYALGCSKAVSQVVMYPLTRMIMKRAQWRNIIVWQTEEFGDIGVRDIIAHLAGYALGTIWLIVSFMDRHAEDLTFFWVMQDVFGTCMCIMFLQVIKLNSIRVATILLLVAFFYDIFFVFVTPLLFKGKSVMITVATSGGPPTADPLWCEKYPDDRNCQGGNPLPMLLTVPRIMDYSGGSSLLGLGDIVLPGLLLSFAARYDAAKSLLGIMGGGRSTTSTYTCPEKRYCWNCGLCSGGYFQPLVVAYAIGLLMANLAVYLMNMGQPALLYLVPCCLGTMCYMGWRRNELWDLWDESKIIRSADSVLYGEPITTPSHVPVPQDDDGGVDVPTTPSAEDGDFPLLDDKA